MKAIVLGGGIAGLTAGIRLAESGATTTIIEAGGQPGGLASGFREDGYTFDLFSHRLWTRDPEVLDLAARWTGGELISRRKVSRILLDDRFYNYPVDLRDLVSAQSGGMALRALVGYVTARLKAPPTDGDFRSYLISRFGEPLFNVFFGPYTEKLYGLHTSEISMDLALGAIPKAGIFRQLVYRMTGKVDRWDEFHYPKGGFMALPEGMASRFVEVGGDLMLGQRLSAIRRKGERIVGVEARGEAGTVSLDADVVVSTVPMTALLSALDSTAPADVAAAAGKLRTRAMVVVYLGVARPQLSEDHWIYVPDSRMLFNRLSETNNYSDAMSPPGHTGVCAEIACERGDEVWSMSDASLAARAGQDLVRTGLLDSPDEVSASWVKRFGSAYPVYDVDYKQHLGTVIDHLDAIPNLSVCGRQGSFWYGSTAQGIRQAIDVVDAIRGSSRHAA
jgi:protoporphyrinogen oxidase